MTRLVMDLGKSACRARAEGTSETWEWEGLPAERAGGPGAPALLADRVLEGLAGAPRPRTVVVGSTFLPPASDLPEVAARVRSAHPGLGVAILDDGLLAHAGALARAGAVASVGTGVIVTVVDEAGRTRRVDGWGPDAGDRGSAVDVGRRGLVAGCAALDGVGRATSLVEALGSHLGRPLDLDAITWLLAAPDHIARLADLARVVLAAAIDGDAVAVGLVQDAAGEVAASCVAALSRNRHLPVTVVGRLGLAAPYADALAAHLARAGLRPEPPRGGPLDASWDAVTRPPYAGATGLIVPPGDQSRGEDCAASAEPGPGQPRPA